jgi:hypothetical protein
LLKQLLRIELQVGRVREGVATFVYRVRAGRDVLYLRVWPFADETFESEVIILQELRRRGVHVPTVLGWEPFNPLLGRSYLLTSNVAGRPLGPEDSASRVRSVLLEAGYELSILNSVRVEGFGWIVRSPDQAAPLRAEHQTWHSFLTNTLRAIWSCSRPASSVGPRWMLCDVASTTTSTGLTRLRRTWRTATLIRRRSCRSTVATVASSTSARCAGPVPCTTSDISTFTVDIDSQSRDFSGSSTAIGKELNWLQTTSSTSRSMGC